MAVDIVRIPVTNVPVEILGGDSGDRFAGKAAVIRNRTTVPVDIVKGSSQAFGTGYELEVGDAVNVELEAGESVWAVAGSAGPHVSLHVIRVGMGS